MNDVTRWIYWTGYCTAEIYIFDKKTKNGFDSRNKQALASLQCMYIDRWGTRSVVYIFVINMGA